MATAPEPDPIGEIGAFEGVDELRESQASVCLHAQPTDEQMIR